MTDAPKIDKKVPLPDDDRQPRSKGVRSEPVHESREFEVWDDNAVHTMSDTPWTHAASLDAPPPRPGFVQRWIRVTLEGDDDPTNVSRKFRDGWRPRLASTVPPGSTPPSISSGRFAGCIGVEGMLLCERPEKMAAKHAAAINEKTRRITEGIEAELQAQSHPNMAISQMRSSQVRRNIRIQED